MTSHYKTYETEFKLEVARLVVEQGLSVPDVMKSTSVGKTAFIAGWRNTVPSKRGNLAWINHSRQSGSAFFNWNLKTVSLNRITTY